MLSFVLCLVPKASLARLYRSRSQKVQLFKILCQGSWCIFPLFRFCFAWDLDSDFVISDSIFPSVEFVVPSLAFVCCADE